MAGGGAWGSGGRGYPIFSDPDWRSKLPVGDRQETINALMRAFHRAPARIPDAPLRNIAAQYEAEIYAASISQDDYMFKSALKMLAISGEETSIPIQPGEGYPWVDPDWRSQFSVEDRQETITAFLNAFHEVPVTIPEATLRNIAVQFEAEIYTASTSRVDYIFKSAVKMFGIFQVNSILILQGGPRKCTICSKEHRWPKTS